MLHSLLIVKNKFDTSDKNYLEINRKLECVLFWINFKKNEGWEVGVVSSLFLNQYSFLLCYANFISVSDQFGWLLFEPFGHSQY